MESAFAVARVTRFVHNPGQLGVNKEKVDRYSMRKIALRMTYCLLERAFIAASEEDDSFSGVGSSRLLLDFMLYSDPDWKKFWKNTAV